MTATCPYCGADVKVTKAGALYKHGDCPGGGHQLNTGGTINTVAAGLSGTRASVSPAALTAVYLVRMGKRNEELRYSIRSLANAGIDRVVLVGYKPPWLDGVEHLPTGQADRAERARNIRRGYEAIAADGPDEFVLFNDDFFVMRNVTIEPTHRGPLSALLHQARPTGYYKGLRAAADLLGPDALAYDAIHTPLPMTRAALTAALEMFDGTHGVRTVTGNLLGYGGIEHPNAKNPPAERWNELTYLSTSDKSFKYRPIGAHIRRRFGHRSRFEVEQ